MSLEEKLKSKGFANEWQRARINVLFSASWLNNEVKLFLAPYGITLKQFNILRILRGQHPNSITIQDVRERMMDKMSDASRIIDRLVKKGFVHKQRCMQDRRANRAYITPHGLSLLKAIDQNIHQMDAIVQNLTANQAYQLNQLLDLMRND